MCISRSITQANLREHCSDIFENEVSVYRLARQAQRIVRELDPFIAVSLALCQGGTAVKRHCLDVGHPFVRTLHDHVIEDALSLR